MVGNGSTRRCQSVTLVMFICVARRITCLCPPGLLAAFSACHHACVISRSGTAVLSSLVGTDCSSRQTSHFMSSFETSIFLSAQYTISTSELSRPIADPSQTHAAKKRCGCLVKVSYIALFQLESVVLAGSITARSHALL
jgi:hypothetical protein